MTRRIEFIATFDQPGDAAMNRRKLKRVVRGMLEQLESRDLLASFVVNSNVDLVDANPGDGSCETANQNQCSFRAAVAEANALAGADEISFAPALANGTIVVGAPHIDINSDLDIDAVDAPGLTISGGGNFRMLHVNSSADAEIANLTLADGDSAGTGGAIHVIGTLVVSNSAFVDNHAGLHGGAVSTAGAGDATFINSTFSGNTADHDGGAIYADGTVAVLNSTLAENLADSNNDGTGFGGGIFRLSGTTLLQNTIVADNARSLLTIPNDISGTVDTTSRFNIISHAATSGGLTDGVNGNQVGDDPQLTTLQDFGGPTFTHGIPSTSPAIDAADQALAPATDQRGLSRPIDGDGDSVAISDIGAYEFGTAIEGTKFDDLNANGVRDAGEPGLANVTIYLDQNGNFELDAGEPSVLTMPDDPQTVGDQTGQYRIEHLPAATYRVSEVIPDGFIQSHPTPIPNTTPTPPVLSSPTRNNTANTTVSTDISTNTTWTTGGSPYEVTNSITVQNGVTLTIDPGVQVLFHPSAQLRIEGTLDSQGTNANPILLTSNAVTQAPGNWIGVLIRNPVGGTAIIDYTTIEYASSAVQVQCCFGAMPGSISNSVIRHSVIGLATHSGNDLFVDRTIFDNNTHAVTAADKVITNSLFTNNDYGLYRTERIDVIGSTFTSNQTALYGGRGLLQYSNIHNNVVGVEALFEGFTTMNNDIVNNDVGMILPSSTATRPILWNNIHSNSVNNIETRGIYNQNLANNFWNSINPVVIEPTIEDGLDNVNLGLAIIEPLLTSAANTGPSIAGQHTVNLTTASSVNNIDFGNYRLGTISGAVYDDVDNDATRGGAEGGLAFWTVYVDANGNDQLDVDEARSTTDVNGNYTIPFVSPGSYDIREIQKAGWNPTDPVTGEQTATIVSGQNLANVEFGNNNPSNALPGELRGTKYSDGNGNGVRDAGEFGLSGWRIYLDTNGNRHWDSYEVSTLTDSNGDYVFANVTPGSYIVREVAQANWDQTAPALQSVAAPILPPMDTRSNLAPVPIGGAILSDLTLTAAGSPYQVTSTMTVFPGVTLTLQPGVELQFDSGAGLNIRGDLIAEGTQSDLILFTSSAPTQAVGDWFGISVQNLAGGTASFQFATIEYAASGISVQCCNPNLVQIQDSYIQHTFNALSGYTGTEMSVTRTALDTNSTAVGSGDRLIVDSFFINNSVGLSQTEGANVENSVFQSNVIAANPRRGSILYSVLHSNQTAYDPSLTAGMTFEYNTVVSNNIGVLLPFGTGPTISNNNILNNSVHNVENVGNGNKEFSGNYWGTTDPNVIAAGIHDQSDNAALGVVNFAPFETNAVSDLPPMEGNHAVVLGAGQTITGLDFGNQYAFSNLIITADDPGGNGRDNTQADEFRLIRSGSFLTVFINNNFSRSIPWAWLNSVTVLGSDDDDEVLADFATGDLLPPGGMAFYGEGTLDFDELIVHGDGSTVGTYAPDATVAGNGEIAMHSNTTGGTITFTGLEPVEMSNFQGVEFLSPNGSDQLVVAADTGSGNQQATTISGTSGGVAFESLTVFDTPELILSLDVNDATFVASDTISFQGAQMAQGLTDMIIRMGTGFDDILIGSAIVSLPGELRIIGEDVGIEMDGGSLSADLDFADGEVFGWGTLDTNVTEVQVIDADGGAFALGNGDAGGFAFAGSLSVDNEVVTLNATGFAALGPATTIAGGQLVAANGIAIGDGDNVTGTGSIDAQVAATVGSTIDASGNLTIGDVGSPAGFFSDGHLQIAQHTVTLLDQDTAVLGSLTTIGGGVLTANNGLLLEAGKTFVGDGTVNTANDEFRNQGQVSATAPGITFNHLVTGAGDFIGTVNFLGGFNPGNSPAQVDLDGGVTFGPQNTLGIELGGLVAGAEFDRIDVSGALQVDGTFAVSLIDSFDPQLGDQFIVATFGSRNGDFSLYQGLDLAGPLKLEAQWTNTDLTLITVPDDEIPPSISGVTINNGIADPVDLPKGPQPTDWATQRSFISQVDVTFSEDIVIAVADLQLKNLGVNAPVDSDTIIPLTPANVSVAGNVLSLSFQFGELPNGVYELTALPTATDVWGNLLDGDGDGNGGDQFVYAGNTNNDFYVLEAEWSGDEGVSVFDFTSFSYWFGLAVPTAPKYVDLNDDNGISVFDFSGFSTNFGTGITFPVALAAGVEVASPVEQLFGQLELVEETVQENEEIEQWLARTPIRVNQGVRLLELESPVEEDALEDVLEEIALPLAEFWNI
jgi:predicted outer membrane repeat protein